MIMTAKTTTMAVDQRGSFAANIRPEISVCICTYKRPELLERLLTGLKSQQTKGTFTYSVLVVDNDSACSAEQVVTKFSSAAVLELTYCVEPQQNIALARNRAVRSANGDYIAFIDDDEFPDDNWLASLLETQQKFGVEGVLGPVLPHFENDPPPWVRRGRFFDRPTYVTGYKMNWDLARTGNVLFKKSILDGTETPFAPEFNTAGEDVDFFRRMMAKGCSFVWCNEAAVHELVPDSRCNRSYLLRRALLRGSNFHKHPTRRFQNVAKSLVAVPAYTLALPLLLLAGQHVFLKYLIKLLDHLSRLLAFVGIHLVTERQT